MACDPATGRSLESDGGPPRDGAPDGGSAGDAAGDGGSVPDAGSDGGLEIACRVEGTTYPSGASSVPDPTSCNTCACDQGSLVNCTEAVCPEPCERGFARGSACVACDPVDRCVEVETGCFTSCSDEDDCTADAPFCETTRGLCIPFPCG